MKIYLKANRQRRSYRECACIFGLCSESRSDTTSYQQQVGASEGSLAVGVGGKFQEAGAVDISGATGKIGSTELDVGGDVNVSSADVAVLKTALDKYAELSSGFGSSLNQFVSRVSEDQDKKVATLLAAVESAKETEDTAAQNRKIFMYIALAVLGLFAFLGFRNR